MTVWYDEAWRMVMAVKEPFWERWFVEGRPVPTSIPHLYFIRCVHGAFGYPASDHILRYVNLLAALGIFWAVWTFALRLTQRRSVALTATLLLATNAYFGYNVIGIKEHIWLVLILVLWALRLHRLIATNENTGKTDAAICLGVMFFSPLAANAIAVITAVLIAKRGFKHDLRLMLGGVLPAAVYGYLQMDAVRIYEERFQKFAADHGVTGAALFAPTTDFSVPQFLLLLAGVPPAVNIIGGILWLAVVVLSGRRIMYWALPALTILFFQFVTGHAEPRMVLWLSPVLGLLAAFAATGKPGGILTSAICVLSLIGWVSLWAKYPQKQRFDLFLREQGFNRETDVLLHNEGLIYFPHEVFDPELPKGVIMIPEKGIDGLVLHPDLEFAWCKDIPRSMLWTDTRLREFRGGAIWTVTSYSHPPQLLSRLEKNLFDGDVTIDTFINFPYYWARARRND